MLPTLTQTKIFILQQQSNNAQNFLSATIFANKSSCFFVVLYALCFVSIFVLIHAFIWCWKTAVKALVEIDTYKSVELQRVICSWHAYLAVFRPCHFRCGVIHATELVVHVMLVILFVCIFLYTFTPQYIQMRLILCAVSPLIATLLRAVISKLSWTFEAIDITPTKTTTERSSADMAFAFDERYSRSGRASRAGSAAETTLQEDDVNFSMHETSMDHPHVPEDAVSDSESKSRISGKWLTKAPSHLIASTLLEDLEIDLPEFGDDSVPLEQAAIVPVGWQDFDFDLDAEDIIHPDHSKPPLGLSNPLPPAKFLGDIDVFGAFQDDDPHQLATGGGGDDVVQDASTLPPTVGNAWSEPASVGHGAELLASDDSEIVVRMISLRTFHRFAFAVHLLLSIVSLVACYYLTSWLEGLGQCPNFSVSVVLAVIVFDMVIVQSLYCWMLVVQRRDVVGDSNSQWTLHPYNYEVRHVVREATL